MTNDVEYLIMYLLVFACLLLRNVSISPVQVYGGMCVWCKHVHVCAVRMPMHRQGGQKRMPCSICSPWDRTSLRQHLHFKPYCFVIIFCYPVFQFLINSRYWPFKRCKGKHKRFGGGLACHFDLIQWTEFSRKEMLRCFSYLPRCATKGLTEAT